MNGGLGAFDPLGLFDREFRFFLRSCFHLVRLLDHFAALGGGRVGPEFPGLRQRVFAGEGLAFIHIHFGGAGRRDVRAVGVLERREAHRHVAGVLDDDLVFDRLTAVPRRKPVSKLLSLPLIRWSFSTVNSGSSACTITSLDSCNSSPPSISATFSHSPASSRSCSQVKVSLSPASSSVSPSGEMFVQLGSSSSLEVQRLVAGVGHDDFVVDRLAHFSREFVGGEGAVGARDLLELFDRELRRLVDGLRPSRQRGAREDAEDGHRGEEQRDHARPPAPGHCGTSCLDSRGRAPCPTRSIHGQFLPLTRLTGERHLRGACCSWTNVPAVAVDEQPTTVPTLTSAGQNSSRRGRPRWTHASDPAPPHRPVGPVRAAGGPPPRPSAPSAPRVQIAASPRPTQENRSALRKPLS